MMVENEQAAIENLRLAIHGITAPFCCEGTFLAEKPVTLVFPDGGRFQVVRAKGDFEQEREIRPLLERAKPAPFGKGKKTRYDRNVRDALQLKAESGEVKVENFDPEAAGILGEVQRGLVPHDPAPISCEFYALNVYTRGGHFAPHKDTPRGSDMFGTLVVCLPAQFHRGRLILNHRGIVRKFDWGRALSSPKQSMELHWAAFFGDVDHQIETVWSGARVTLTYLLRRGKKGQSIPDAADAADGADAATAPTLQESWSAMLSNRKFMPKGGVLGYPCCHLYHQDARFQQTRVRINPETATMLKGRDHLVAASALEAGLKVQFHPYMFENCADETWQLERFPTRSEKACLGRQMDAGDLEKALPIHESFGIDGDTGIDWIEDPPSSDKSTWRAEKDDSGLPMAALLHSCEYCQWGYFGNEGSDVDLYTFAALHVEIPPLGKGARKAAKGPKRPKSTKSPKSPVKRRRTARKKDVSGE
jgi:hypothetical protein